MHFWILGLFFVFCQAPRDFNDLVEEKEDEFMGIAYRRLDDASYALRSLESYEARLEKNRMNFVELTQFYADISSFIRSLDSFNLDMFKLNKKMADELREIGKNQEDSWTLNKKIREFTSERNENIGEMSEGFSLPRQKLVTLLNECNRRILSFFNLTSFRNVMEGRAKTKSIT